MLSKKNLFKFLLEIHFAEVHLPFANRAVPNWTYLQMGVDLKLLVMS